MIRSRFRYLLELWDRYERPLAAISLTVGFVFDLFLAKRPDSVYDNLLLVSYLFIAAALILILNIRTYRRRDIEPQATPLFLLLVLQFCFGGLSSNLLVLYGKSGTFAGSTLFLLFLFAMLVGNEFLKSRYAQLRFNVVIYYTLLLTYCIIAVPTFILHSVGTLVFLASGLLSLAIITGFLWLLYLIVFRGRDRAVQIYEVSVLVLLVFFFYNALYFMNIIPPVPLSLKNIGIYHQLTRLPAAAGTDDAIYSATYEDSPWYIFWRDTSATYDIGSASTAQASCFSSVFAPTGLSAPIYHRWERRDDTGKWVTMSRISFPINGGRGEGFRGFTVTSVTPGHWRCDVETEGGALIGRISFNVVESSTTAALSTKAL
ncbi:MAG TPA: DUF2914 domain-containing protein [Candidatus Paceibacterota bacterium]|nr:DUF2914 domain-containing protein [Candidatus Paceibacterota bacterium]